MSRKFEFNPQMFDYLIARSGIIGRQILRLCRYISTDDEEMSGVSGLKGFWFRQRRLRRMMVIRVISRGLMIFYTYYVGGSLTRSDQVTFGKLLGMDGKAYRLTLFNALFCGIPCAMGYFLLGEGFSLLKKVHSYAELPSLLAQHTSLAIGAVSLAVDLFRAADSARHRRCWAPFGFLPLVINLPTYLKRIFQRSANEIKPTGEGLHRPGGNDADPDSGCESVTVSIPDDPDRRSSDLVSKKYSNSCQPASHLQ